MNTRSIRLPDIGEGITEAEIVEWQVAVGDTIVEDQTIGSAMTDKAAVEIPSPVAGVVESLNCSVGEILAVGSELASIRVEDARCESVDQADTVIDPDPDPDVVEDETQEATPSTLAQANDPPFVAESNRATESERAIVSEPALAPTSDTSDSDAPALASAPAADRPSADRSSTLGKPIASPAVRRRAYRSNVSLSEVSGSGPGGRILHEDIDRHERMTIGRAEQWVAEAGEQEVRPSGDSGDVGQVREIAVIGLRRVIARRMQTAKQRIPHFSYVEEADVTDLEALRAQLNARANVKYPRLTLLPFVVTAVMRAIEQFPGMNARFDDEAGIIHEYREAHVGIATQTDGGLMVPVLHRAQALDIRALAAGIAELAEAARDGRLKPDDMRGGTITITSLGTLGGLVSTPIINHPEVAIVGVNRIIERPMYIAGKVAPRQLMNLSCSFDHRVVDGHDAARFVQAIKSGIEFPASLFVPVG